MLSLYNCMYGFSAVLESQVIWYFLEKTIFLTLSTPLVDNIFCVGLRSHGIFHIYFDMFIAVILMLKPYV